MTRKTITLERTFKASLEEVWELWTTPAGIAAWWGPEGFATEVLKLELKPGGALRYRMTATGPDQIAFMKRANLPLAQEVGGTFTEVAPPTRLTLVQLADFIPGVAPYPMAARVELEQRGPEVRMVVTLDAAHDETWTERSVAGWNQQLDRLVRAAQAR